MNFADRLAQHALLRASHPAIELGDRVITYAEFNGLVDKTAARLHGAGVRPGDFVGVLVPTCAEHPVVLYALARVGAVVLSLSDRLLPVERQQTIGNLPVRKVVAPVGAALPDGTERLPLEDICRPSSAEPKPFKAISVGPDHPLLCIQSSGTTGAPKSLLRTHGAMQKWVDRCARNGIWHASDRYLAVVRIDFSGGRNNCFAVLQLGGTVVLENFESFTDVAASINDKRITILFLSPAHVNALLDLTADGSLRFPALKTVFVGTAPIPHNKRMLARRRLTSGFCEMYGTNETGPIAVARPADQDAYPEAAGQVLEGVEAEIVDDADRPLPAGEVGHIRVRGDGFPEAYYQNPEASARAFRDGWFYPGDSAAMNAEGYIFFKGRTDDIINNEGVKFYPIELEQVLRSHPAIADAAVFGWPHTQHGEVSVAYVVARSPVSGDELIQFCSRQLSAYKLPHRIVPVPELPKNPMGKVVKARLKEMFRQQRRAERSDENP